MDDATFDIDARLTEVSRSLNFLAQVTPTNGQEAWHAFCSSGYGRVPTFCYRPLPRRLDASRRTVGQIDCRAIGHRELRELMEEKQMELSCKLGMLHHRGTPQFLQGSIQVFGCVDSDLLSQACGILQGTGPRTTMVRHDRFGPRRNGTVDAAQFCRRAEAEIAYYRHQHRSFDGRARVSRSVSHMQIVRGVLSIPLNLQVAAARVEPLLHHEIGTHLLTSFNGRLQPLRQLELGLPGYYELQEGLAVLSEYLCGGLNAPRLRELAIRVVATGMLLEEATFVDIFRRLYREYACSARAAFTATMRVCRAGGFTRDAAYLRGLIGVIRYLRSGGKLRPLFVGRISLSHLPVVRWLECHELLLPPSLIPRYLDHPAARQRLDRLCQIDSVLHLLEGCEV